MGYKRFCGNLLLMNKWVSCLNGYIYFYCGKKPHTLKINRSRLKILFVPPLIFRTGHLCCHLLTFELTQDNSFTEDRIYLLYFILYVMILNINGCICRVCSKIQFMILAQKPFY